jgi:hypothetical protein
LLWYGSRWYDSELGRFIQPDSIVPSVGEGNNPSSIGYVPQENYSALIVDYHEGQFLEQMNEENRTRNGTIKKPSPSVPTNPLAFDRYAYTLNNSIRYNDPSGHCVWDLCIVEGTGLVELSIAVIATVATIEATSPGRPEAFAQSMVDLGEQASQGLQAVFSKKEYVPPGLSEAERNAYREAVHRYKTAHGVGAAEDVARTTLDKIAEGIKKGLKPRDAADKAPAPPEDE